MISVKKLDDRNILVNEQGYHATWRARTMGDDVVLEERHNGIILRDHYGNIQVVDEAGESRTYDSSIEAMQALNEFIGNFKTAGGAAQQPCIVVPDYANIESINRITTGSWQTNETNYSFASEAWTADRAGFVLCGLDFAEGETPPAWRAFNFYINGRVVASIGSSGFPNTGCVFGYRQILPVTAGDVISLAAVGSNIRGEPRFIHCYFIPPILVEIMKNE